jgi:hypothetical protein
MIDSLLEQILPTRQGQVTLDPAEACRAPRLSPMDLRWIFIGQARLLAARAERGLPTDARSMANLVAVCPGLVCGEVGR